MTQSGSRDLYMLVHGLGGSAERPYMNDAASAISRRGYDTLRLSMRGAGKSGADFYHAGLASDLAAVLASPSLADYARVFLIGFSLGGHIGVHLARDRDRDPRLRALVAICSPLDLAANARIIDSSGDKWLYRRHVLDGLTQIHRKVHGHSPRFRWIRQWDSQVVVPRFGFDSAEHYWASQSAGPRLRGLDLPVLWVATEHDPMVPAETVAPYLARAGSSVDVRWLRRGGHVGFPPDADLGLPGERGLVPQILSWCAKLG